MKTTPDFLRGVAVARIVGIMANAHEGGTWSLVEVSTIGGMSILKFKVGMIHSDTQIDDRQIVEFTVEEK